MLKLARTQFPESTEMIELKFNENSIFGMKSLNSKFLWLLTSLATFDATFWTIKVPKSLRRLHSSCIKQYLATMVTSRTWQNSHSRDSISLITWDKLKIYREKRKMKIYEWKSWGSLRIHFYTYKWSDRYLFIVWFLLDAFDIFHQFALLSTFENLNETTAQCSLAKSCQ